MSVYSFESTDLKHEINILHDTNKKLADTNELLLGEMAAIKAKTKLKKNSNQASTPKSLQNCTKFFPNKPNYLTSEKPVTDDDLSDEEIDSGNWTVNSDLDVEQNKNSFSKEIDICNQKKNLNSIVEKSRSKEPQKILPDRTFKICFVGDSSVGKTSFIIRYCRNEFSQSTSATLGVDFHMKNVVHEDTNIALQLWDTCGQERFRSIAVSYFRKADAAVLMYDCTNEQSFLNVREWIQSINYMVDNPVPIILIANKIDLRNEYKAVGKRVISHDEGFILAKDYGTLFFETSTKIGTNIGESLVDLCSLMVANQEKEIIESSNIDNIKLGVETQSFKKKCC